MKLDHMASIDLISNFQPLSKEKLMMYLRILNEIRYSKAKRLMINAKCADCKSSDLNHVSRRFRATITECEVFDCPLHSFRPYTTKTVHKSTQSDVKGVV